MSGQWAYGVTTVWNRLQTPLLENTLRSLAAAGFDRPRVFADGISPETWARYADVDVDDVSGVTFRDPQVKAYPNWLLGLVELYLRDPCARYYAMFQDDLTICNGTREYVERTAFGPYSNRYLNLYTYRENDSMLYDRPNGWHEAFAGAYHNEGGAKSAGQAGRGAVALVFDNEGVRTLLGSRHLYERMATPCPTCTRNNDYYSGGCSQCGYTGRVVTASYDRSIDGCIVHVMNQAGYREYVHKPSLVQHQGCYTAPGVGYPSTISGQNRRQAQTWRGEAWNPLSLLEVATEPADPARCAGG